MFSFFFSPFSFSKMGPSSFVPLPYVLHLPPPFYHLIIIVLCNKMSSHKIQSQYTPPECSSLSFVQWLTAWQDPMSNRSGTNQNQTRQRPKSRSSNTSKWLSVEPVHWFLYWDGLFIQCNIYATSVLTAITVLVHPAIQTFTFARELTIGIT